MHLTSEQRTKWHIVYSLAQNRQENESDADHDEMEDQLVELLMLLICHETGSYYYLSPWLSFTTMLAIKLSTGS